MQLLLRLFLFSIVTIAVLMPQVSFPATSPSKFLTVADYIKILSKELKGSPFFSQSASSMSKEELYSFVSEAMKKEGIYLLEMAGGNKVLTRTDFTNITYTFLTGNKGENFTKRKLFLKKKGLIDPNDIGSITSFEGNIIKIPFESEEKISITGIEPVILMDTFETDENSRIQLQLDDMSVLNIGEETSIEINKMIFEPQKNIRQTIVTLAYGRLRVKVENYLSEKYDFKIHTPSVVVGVRGTEFIVNTDKNGNTNVITLSGLVSMRPITDDDKKEADEKQKFQRNEESVLGEFSPKGPAILISAGYTAAMKVGAVRPKTPFKVLSGEIERAFKKTSIINPVEIIRGIKETEIAVAMDISREVFANLKPLSRKKDTPEDTQNDVLTKVAKSSLPLRKKTGQDSPVSHKSANVSSSNQGDEGGPTASMTGLVAEINKTVKKIAAKNPTGKSVSLNIIMFIVIGVCAFLLSLLVKQNYAKIKNIFKRGAKRTKSEFVKKYAKNHQSTTPKHAGQTGKELPDYSKQGKKSFDGYKRQQAIKEELPEYTRPDKKVFDGYGGSSHETKKPEKI